jgi:hypothetical protein
LVHWWKGQAAAALAAELVHKGLERVSDNKATVGRPRTT